MPISTTVTAHIDNTSVAASATNTLDGVDFRTSYGGVVLVKMVNATGLSVGGTVDVQVSHDNTTYVTKSTITGNLTAAEGADAEVPIAMGTQYVRTIYTGGTGAAITMTVVIIRVDQA